MLSHDISILILLVRNKYWCKWTWETLQHYT